MSDELPQRRDEDMSIPTSYAAAVAISVMMVGCAGVNHDQIVQAPLPFKTDGSGVDESVSQPVRNENARSDADFKGIRYYGTSLYLLVYSDGRGNIVWKVLELPDQTKLMSAKPYNLLARLEVQLTFANGTLARASQFVDATAVPRALIEAAAKVAPLLGLFDAAAYQVPAPRLYKIVPIPGGFEFVGNAELKEGIRVTVPGGGK
jgi:hypothetical protein